MDATIRHCDLTLPTPELNLACDEALLEQCERDRTQLLRFWEPTQYFVVVGYANQVEKEVNVQFCQASQIPILRRCTGGGTVLQGPGCLNYSLILHFDNSGPLATISGTNQFVLDRNRQALAPLLTGKANREGQTDLALAGLKFSGNAQRRRKDFLLFHGSFLLQFDLSLIEKALPLPSREPEYRAGRSHIDFLMNLNIASATLKAALASQWSASQPLDDLPSDRIAALARDKYGAPEWNLKF